MNVWCGLIGNRLLGPHFFDEPLTGEVYLNFLENELTSMLEDLPLSISENVIFHQDAAPWHNKLAVRGYLVENFGEDYIASKGPIKWPSRSPDLNPVDFYLWIALQEIVYRETSHNVYQFKERIHAACREIKPQMIEYMLSKDLLKRFEACCEAGGEHFEELL